ncbi:hypothetical protein NPIL_156821 [Nephila pilipes]|uniref:Uncharacterized protein n=1 Tax=Nephila pilipes TaxID=299642 RepID=A0A8X6TN18_NEPPI|nr:hypothetical protein NPIL_156821 [Nephila pilipes]
MATKRKRQPSSGSREEDITAKKRIRSKRDWHTRRSSNDYRFKSHCWYDKNVSQAACMTQEADGTQHWRDIRPDWERGEWLRKVAIRLLKAGSATTAHAFHQTPFQILSGVR